MTSNVCIEQECCFGDVETRHAVRELKNGQLCLKCLNSCDCSQRPARFSSFYVHTVVGYALLSMFCCGDVGIKDSLKVGDASLRDVVTESAFG